MNRHCRRPGLLIILLGISVILAMVLPSGFWGIMTGVVLVAIGISMIRR